MIIILSFVYYCYYYYYHHHQYYYKLAVVSHLFKMNQLKVNFGLLRDPYFLAASMGAVTYSFFLSYYLTCLQLIHFKKV